MNRRAFFASIAGIVSFFGTKAVSEASLQWKKLPASTLSSNPLEMQANPHYRLLGEIADVLSAHIQRTGKRENILITIDGSEKDPAATYFGTSTFLLFKPATGIIEHWSKAHSQWANWQVVADHNRANGTEFEFCCNTFVG